MARPQDPEAVLAAIEGWPVPDRSLALRLHSLVQEAPPHLTLRLWYGMPAYALKGKVVCFFQPAHRFKTRYATLGFTDQARLDQGRMWPVAFALKDLGLEEEAQVQALLRRAVG